MVKIVAAMLLMGGLLSLVCGPAAAAVRIEGQVQAWLIVDMTQTGSEPLPPKGVLGPTFRPDAIEGSRSASAHISIAPEI
jgi:hypothetical protein